MNKKTIEVSEDLYTAIQKLKEVFQEMTGQPIEKDEDVLSILIGGFIDSLAQAEGGKSGGSTEERSEAA